MDLSSREFKAMMRSAGYTRQWRYKRDRTAWRIDEAEVRGLRWCLLCGRDLDPDATLRAVYCSNSCRVRALRKRRARGVVPGWLKQPSFRKNCYTLDALEMESARSSAFYLIHGKMIENAPEICQRWGEGPRDGA